MTARRLAFFLMLIVLLLGGCGRLKPVNMIAPTEKIPPKRAIVFFIDGLNRQVFQDMLRDGQLPNIDRYLVQRGTQVETAVTAIPTITYAVTTSMLTGWEPAHHGILGNSYFDRNQMFFANFNTIPTYRDPDLLYRTPTIFEILNDKYTVSIQTAIRRGVSFNIDNWALSGIRWYFGQFEEVDCLVAEQFNLIADQSQRVGRWPNLIWVYMPATDEIGHHHGPDSNRYHRCLINVDDQIGRICKSLIASRLFDETYLALFADHGMVPCPQDNYIKIAPMIAERFNLKVTDHGPDYNTAFADRAVFFNNYDVVVVNGGFRIINLHVKGRKSWLDTPDPDKIRAIGDILARQPAVGLISVPQDSGVLLRNALGTSLVECQQTVAHTPINEKQYRYRVIDGTDPLGYAGDPCAAPMIDGGYHSGRDWLAATKKNEYPDLVCQIGELFDSPRAGDLVIFAAKNWDFSRENIAGHGGATDADIAVPMIFAGPNIPASGKIGQARIVDLAPTLIDILDSEKLKHYEFDGQSLWPKLKIEKP